VSPAENYAALEHDELVRVTLERDREIAEQEREIEKLKNILIAANKAKYGPKTEKLSSDQLALSFEVAPVQLELPTEKEIVVPAHARTIPRGRKPLPDSLPREEKIYTPEVTHCSCCNTELVSIGEHRTEELEKIPAQLKVIEHVRAKLACPSCKGAGVLVAKLPPSVLPIEGARPGPGLLADIIVSKYVDHLPLHRQEQMFLRHGVELSRKRMCDWVGKVVELLLPLYNQLKREVLSHSYIQADETTIKIQDGETPEHCHTGYLWGVHGPPRLIWFHYAPGRSGEVPKEILQGYRGVIQTDAYAGYNPVFVPEGATRIACFAHVRRKFIEVQSSAGSACARILKLIAAIYQKEASAKTTEARLLVRKNCTRAMAVELLQKSPLSKAIAYALNQKGEIERIFDSGEFELDNNPIERQMKYIAIGRKNYYFAGSHDGATRAAVLYSLLGTCRLNKVNPWEWLRDVLEKVHVHPASRVEELLPHRWRKSSDEILKTC
jgi:transposase